MPTNLTSRPSVFALAFGGAFALLLAMAPIAYADTPAVEVTATVSTSTVPSTLTVSATFTAATTSMNTAFDPGIFFTPDVSANLATTSAQWTFTSAATSTYTAVYDIASGYHVDGITATVTGAVDVDGNTVPDAVSSPFSYNTLSWNITASAGANGTTTPSGVVSVLDGDSQTFTFVPDFGYRVESITIDGATTTTSATTSTFTAVSADHSISASFVSFGSATTSPALVTLPSNVLTVIASYNQEMASTTLPISFAAALADVSADFLQTSAGWSNGTTTYTATFSVAGGLTLGSVTTTIGTSTDAQGGTVNALSTGTFAVDTVAPIGFVSAPSSIVNVASSTVMIATDFDKAMASTTLSTQFFSAANADITSSFTLAGAGWVTSMRYLATYTANSGVNQSGMTAVTSGATATNGNPAASATSSPFTVDTAVANGSAATGVSVVNVLNNTVTVTTTFDKPMASTTLAVAFAAGLADVSGSFSAGSASWTSSTTYAALFTAAPNVYQSSVTAIVSGASDTSGNATATSSTPSFILDTVVPTGSATAPTSSAVVNVANDTVTIVMDFSKTMASTTLSVSFANATSSADLSSSFVFAGATWSNATSTYTTTYQALSDIYEPSVVASVSGGLDTDGNNAAATTTAAFTVDTLVPSGMAITPSASALFNIASDSVTVTVSFSEPMASTTLPVQFLSATSSDISAQFMQTSASWASPFSYSAVFTAAANLFQSGITAVISGAEDLQGNPAPATSTQAFVVDTLAPSASVVSSTPLVNVAADTVTITTDFSKSMDATQAPTITFAVGGMDVSSFFTATATPLSARWTNGTTTYTLLFTATSSFATSSIVAAVSGARDANQNLAPSAASSAFSVDTVAPVATITPPGSPIALNVANPAITIVIDFDKPMASTTLTVTFANASSTDVTAQFSPVSASWTSTSSYTAVFDALPGFADSGIVADISGATDTNGNAAASATTSPFSADTILPSASTITPSAAAVFNIASNTITVTASFNKSMASTTLQVDFAPVGIYSFLATTTASWTDAMTYSAVFQAATGFQNSSVSVTVSGAADLSGNPASATSTPIFLVDTIAPAGSVTTPAAFARFNSYSDTILFEALFDKPMASTTPLISFSSANTQGFLATTSISWVSSTLFAATYHLERGFQDPALLITISGALDTVGNLAPATTTEPIEIYYDIPLSLGAGGGAYGGSSSSQPSAPAATPSTEAPVTPVPPVVETPVPEVNELDEIPPAPAPVPEAPVAPPTPSFPASFPAPAVAQNRAPLVSPVLALPNLENLPVPTTTPTAKPVTKLGAAVYFGAAQTSAFVKSVAAGISGAFSKLFGFFR